MTAAELVNLSLNWRSLRDIIAGHIRIEQQVMTTMADHPATVARCQAKIEALRNVQAAMETLEAASIEDDPPEYDPDGEAERAGETFDQAATDYARIETGEL